MTKIRYASSARVRQAAHAVSKDIWSNDEINDVIDRISLHLHLELGRATTSAYTKADKEFQSVRLYTLYKAACEILMSLDDMETQSKRYCDAAKDVLDALSKGGSVTITKAHHNLIDALDADLYSQDFG